MQSDSNKRFSLEYRERFKRSMTKPAESYGISPNLKDAEASFLTYYDRVAPVPS